MQVRVSGYGTLEQTRMGALVGPPWGVLGPLSAGQFRV